MTDENWTEEDLAEMEVNRVRTGAPRMATAVKLDGFPTIHEIAKLGVTVHHGFGYFSTTGPDWKLEWNGGGAMYRTTSGKAYTPVFVEGSGNPFEESTNEARDGDSRD